MTSQQKAELAPTIAKQLEVQSVEVLESLKYGGWSIIYVRPPHSDEAFLFFSGNPLKTRHVALWGGVAAPFEEDANRRWARENVRGIPPRLAACFAWHVAKEGR